MKKIILLMSIFLSLYGFEKKNYTMELLIGSKNIHKVFVDKNNIKDLNIINISILKTPNNIEPSGLSFKENDIDSLYIASDNGKLCEYNEIDKNMNCTNLNKNEDIEGISFKDNSMFLGLEGIDSIKNENGDIIKLNRKLNNYIVLDKRSPNGIEALSYLYSDNNKDYFIISNQSKKIFSEDASSLIKFFIKNKKASIIESYQFNIIDISGVTYINNKIVFISDTENLLVVFNEETKETQLYNLPGKDQEGIAYNEVFNILYIAQDSGDILKINLKGRLF
jgi:hypothetical protein